VQVGAQRIIREVLFPQTRREFGDPGSGVLRDALDVDFSILTHSPGLKSSRTAELSCSTTADSFLLDVATNCYCAT